MKKIGFVLDTIGVILILIFAPANVIQLDKGVEFKAAQMLGVEVGAVLILIGIGFITIKRDWEKPEIKKSARNMLERGLNLPHAFWVVSTFLVLYVLFFVSPMFFSRRRVQYFTKYIPDAWVTKVGFDIATTVDHVDNWLSTKQSPYSDGIVPYSPLTLAIFAPLLIVGYPDYYKLLTLVTISCFILATLLIPLLVVQRKNYTLPLLFFILGLFSYGFQFEMERGQFNVIAFALCLSAIYIYHYQHKFRFFAYLLFSLSIQLKLYPLIFMIMFIKDWRDWKNNIKRILGLGAFNFSLLFVLGYQIFIEFIQSISARQLHGLSSRNEDLSIRGFVYSLTTGGLGPIQANTFAQHTGLIEMFFLILFGLCLLSMIVHIYLHKMTGMNTYLLAVCTMIALVIPTGSFDYKLPILVAPMTLVLCGLPAIQSTPKKVAAILLVVGLSIAYWSTFYSYTVKPGFLAKNFPALFVILISITFLYFLAGGKMEGQTDDI